MLVCTLSDYVIAFGWGAAAGGGLVAAVVLYVSLHVRAHRRKKVSA